MTKNVFSLDEQEKLYNKRNYANKKRFIRKMEGQGCSLFVSMQPAEEGKQLKQQARHETFNAPVGLPIEPHEK